MAASAIDLASACGPTLTLPSPASGRGFFKEGRLSGCMLSLLIDRDEVESGDSGIDQRHGLRRLTTVQSDHTHSTCPIRSAPLATIASRSKPSAMPLPSGMPWSRAARNDSSVPQPGP